jgi:hypothetical protein
MSEGKLLDAERSRAGLYPVLLEYCEDWHAPSEGPGAPVAAAEYLHGQWPCNSCPAFPKWPGLATHAGAGLNPDSCAAEMATTVVRQDLARCLALIRVEQGADAPAALH